MDPTARRLDVSLRSRDNVMAGLWLAIVAARARVLSSVLSYQEGWRKGGGQYGHKRVA